MLNHCWTFCVHVNVEQFNAKVIQRSFQYKIRKNPNNNLSLRLITYNIYIIGSDNVSSQSPNYLIFILHINFEFQEVNWTTEVITHLILYYSAFQAFLWPKTLSDAVFHNTLDGTLTL